MEDKFLNHLISSARVVVENVLAGVQRCRIVGLDHRVGHFRPLRMATKVLECHIYLRLGRFGLENRLLGWPTP